MNMNIDRECLSKIRYSSEEEADQRMRILFNEGYGELNSYRCLWCHGIHLSSSARSIIE